MGLIPLLMFFMSEQKTAGPGQLYSDTLNSMEIILAYI